MKTCPVCGKEFTPNSGVQKYCSPKCARKIEAEKNYDHIKKRTRGRYDIGGDLAEAFHLRCALCGWFMPQTAFLKKFSRTNGCEFHHIVPVKEGGTNSYENIILLCPNCHKMADHGVIAREELLKHTFSKEEAHQEAEKYVTEQRLKFAAEYCIDKYYHR